MNRPYYSEYVRHMMRFYARSLRDNPIGHPHFKTEVDKNNWFACHSVVKHYSDIDKDILVSVYGGYDTLPDEVYNMAKKYRINQNIIWDLMKEFERRLAHRRGLI